MRGPARATSLEDTHSFCVFLLRNTYAPGRAVAGRLPAVTGNRRLPSVDQSTAVVDEPTTADWRPAQLFFRTRKKSGARSFFLPVTERPRWRGPLAVTCADVCLPSVTSTPHVSVPPPLDPPPPPPHMIGPNFLRGLRSKWFFGAFGRYSV